MNPFRLIRRLFDWVLSWAEKRYGRWALAVLSFAEASFFPIPPDPLLVALCLGSRTRAFYFALICSVASVLGGLAGYAIGHFAFDKIGEFILKWYEARDLYVSVQGHYAEHGFLYVLLAGFTPIPYKIFTIAAGVFELNLFAFVMASAISRSARFFLVAAAIYRFGVPVMTFINRWFNLLTIAFAILLIGSFLVLKMITHTV